MALKYDMDKGNVNNFIRINLDMNILAFDLANFSSSLALMKQGKIVFSEYNEEFRGQDVTLLPKLQKILADHDLTFQELDRLATTRGPGSFTGIRVALATAQGLSLGLSLSASYAADVPALGIDSFSWALNTFPKKINPEQPLLVLLESLRLELYGQLFTGTGEKIEGPFSLSPADIAKTAQYKKALCLGNGAHHLAPYGFEVECFMPQATHLAELASKIPPQDFENYPCLPLYIRDADTTKAKKLK